jgi:hypothetical protein
MVCTREVRLGELPAFFATMLAGASFGRMLVNTEDV